MAILNSILRTIGAIGLRAPNREEPVEISQQPGEALVISGRCHVTIFFFFDFFFILTGVLYFVLRMAYHPIAIIAQGNELRDILLLLLLHTVPILLLCALTSNAMHSTGTNHGS